MLGLALGDALGRPLEFLSVEEIRARHGPKGLVDPEGRLETTDDTGMAVAVAEALAAAGTEGPDELMVAVTREFVRWGREVRPEHSPGPTCLEATARLEAGVPWMRSGLSWSKGSGAVMRAAPVGFYFARHPVLLREMSRQIARVTHGHPTAEAAAVAVATLVREALRGSPPESWVASVLRATSGLADGEIVEALRAAIPAAAMPDEVAAMESLGQGWVSEEAAAMGISAVLRHPDDFAAAVRCAVNHGGDSDTVGAIAGAISGARLGEEGLLDRWLGRLEGIEALERVAERLAASRERLR